MKIAYVSDSVGSPIHPRGIFHYSANFIKLLSAQGHEIDVVLTSPQMITKKPFKLSDMEPELNDVIKSAIIGSFLANPASDRPLHNPQNFLTSFLKYIINKILDLTWINAIFSFIPFYYEKPLIVTNKFKELDYIPLAYSFFKNVRNFLLFKRTYHQNPSLPAKKIDLRNYDLILLDTPHHLKFKKNSEARIVSIIHDVLPFTDLFMFSYARRIFMKKINSTLGISDKLIFVSKVTERIFNKYVIYSNPTAIVHPIFSPNITLDMLAKHNFLTSKDSTHAPVRITTIVSFDIRKNLQGIIDAHRLLPEHYHLEVIGQVNPKHYRISSECARRIKFIGYVSEAQKASLLYTTDIFCYPSLAEGFGIPVIEGLYYTGRVVCSDIPVFRETAGKYAIFCDPASPFDIATKIHEASALPKLDKVTRELAVFPFTAAAQMSVVENLTNQGHLKSETSFKQPVLT